MNTNAAHVAEPDFLRPEDEISLTDLIHTLWLQRGLILGCTLLVVMAVLSFHFFKLSFAVPHRVDFPVSLTFLGNSNEYPNGTPFSPRDLVAPSVLDAVISQRGLTLTVDELAAALSVNFSNSLMLAGETKLTQLLAEARTPEDIRRAAAQVLDDVRRESSHFITLGLDLKESGLAADQAGDVARAIVDTWAQQAVRRGLMNININRPMTPFIISDAMNLIDVYDNAAVYLVSLRNTVRQLSALPGNDSLLVNGRTLDDINRDLKTLDTVDVGPLREFAYSNAAELMAGDPAGRVRLLARQRLLALEQDRLEKLIRSYDRALDQLASGASGEQLRPVSSGHPMAGTQLDQSFLNSMLELGHRLGGVDMRQQLFERRTRAVEDLLSLEKEIAILGGSLDAKTYEGLDSRMILRSALDGIADRLNHLQQQLDAFVAVYRDQTLQSGGRLFIADAGPVVRGGTMQLGRQVGLHLLLAVVSGGLLGLLLALVRAVLRAHHEKE